MANQARGRQKVLEVQNRSGSEFLIQKYKIQNTNTHSCCAAVELYSMFTSQLLQFVTLSFPNSTWSGMTMTECISSMCMILQLICFLWFKGEDPVKGANHHQPIPMFTERLIICQFLHPDLGCTLVH